MVRFKEYLRLLHEIKDSKRNRAQFRKVYGPVSHDDIKDIFKRFTTQQSRLTKKDIFSYDSLDSLESAIFDISNTKAKKGGDEEAKIRFPRRAKPGSVELYKSEDVLVVKVDDPHDAKYYGHDLGRICKWCVSENPNTFDEYRDDGDFIFIIDSTGDKFALYYAKDSVPAVYDINDTLSSPILISTKYPEIIPSLQKAGVNIKPTEEYILHDDGKGLVFPKSRSGESTVYLTYEYDLRDGVKDNHPAYSEGHGFIWLKDGKPWKKTDDMKGEKILKEFLSHDTSIEYQYFSDGKIYSKTTKRNDELQSFDDKPAVTLYMQKGVQWQGWYNKGELHREGGPAELKYNTNTGEIVEKIWATEGEKNSQNDQPSEIKYHKGIVTKKIWHKDDVKKREEEFRYDGSGLSKRLWYDDARNVEKVIYYWNDGSIKSEQILKKGRKFTGKSFFEDGGKRTEYTPFKHILYYKTGEIKRILKYDRVGDFETAIIEYYKNGNKKSAYIKSKNPSMERDDDITPGYRYAHGEWDEQGNQTTKEWVDDPVIDTY